MSSSGGMLIVESVMVEVVAVVGVNMATTMQDQETILRFVCFFSFFLFYHINCYIDLISCWSLYVRREGRRNEHISNLFFFNDLLLFSFLFFSHTGGYIRSQNPTCYLLF
jgi:hypothetical protein